MKVQLEHILQNFFQKPSLDEIRVDDLQQMVKEHPYFGAGHFLLAQKLKQQHNDGYDEQLQKAVLYFHDPLWLHWQLKQAENGKTKPAELEPEEELAVTTVGPVEEGIPATPAEAEQNLPDEIQAPAPAEETPPPTEEQEPIETPVEEDRHPAEQEIIHEPESFHEPEPVQPEIQLLAQEPVKEESPGQDRAKKQPHQQEPALAFDPYYTIDYFASQGIKAPVEVQPGDKLGKQLKSFTEWLKTMKRLPQARPEEQPVDEAEQQNIRKFAAGSLEEKEVVTEAMAEVLAKQGRNAEAIAIYNKLSLSDPSKSAYFAAKIENLKEN